MNTTDTNQPVPKTDEENVRNHRRKLENPQVWNVDENGEMQTTFPQCGGYVSYEDYLRLWGYVEDLEGTLVDMQEVISALCL